MHPEDRLLMMHKGENPFDSSTPSNSHHERGVDEAPALTPSSVSSNNSMLQHDHHHNNNNNHNNHINHINIDNLTSIHPIGGQNMVTLPENFEPGEHDVICGRGRKSFNHVGNAHFRDLVASYLEQYASAPKVEKSFMLSDIVNKVRMLSPNGGFVKKDPGTNRWHEVGDFLAREKTSQAFRDALHDQYKSSNTAKKKRRQAERAGRFYSREHSNHSLGDDSQTSDQGSMGYASCSTTTTSGSFMGTVITQSTTGAPMGNASGGASPYEDPILTGFEDDNLEISFRPYGQMRGGSARSMEGSSPMQQHSARSLQQHSARSLQQQLSARSLQQQHSARSLQQQLSARSLQQQHSARSLQLQQQQQSTRSLLTQPSSRSLQQKSMRSLQQHSARSMVEMGHRGYDMDMDTTMSNPLSTESWLNRSCPNGLTTLTTLASHAEEQLDMQDGGLCMMMSGGGGDSTMEMSTRGMDNHPMSQVVAGPGQLNNPQLQWMHQSQANFYRANQQSSSSSSSSMGSAVTATPVNSASMTASGDSMSSSMEMMGGGGGGPRHFSRSQSLSVVQSQPRATPLAGRRHSSLSQPQDHFLRAHSHPQDGCSSRGSGNPRPHVQRSSGTSGSPVPIFDDDEDAAMRMDDDEDDEDEDDDDNFDMQDHHQMLASAVGPRGNLLFDRLARFAEGQDADDGNPFEPVPLPNSM